MLNTCEDESGKCTPRKNNNGFTTNYEKFSTKLSQISPSEGETSPQQTSNKKKVVILILFAWCLSS